MGWVSSTLESGFSSTPESGLKLLDHFFQKAEYFAFQVMLLRSKLVIFLSPAGLGVSIQYNAGAGDPNTMLGM